MRSLIHERVEQARAGRHPCLVSRVASGFVVLGDRQIRPGYCLLLPDPVVPTLNALEGAARHRFLADWAGVGDALLAVTGAARINYEILGNLEPALHAHLFPRFGDEPEHLRTKPIWVWDWDEARPAEPDGADAALIAALRVAIAERGLAV